MKMDSVKQTLKAGLGATVVTAEKLEAALQDLVNKGRISADEARQTAQKFAEQSKTEFHETKESMEKRMQQWFEKAPIVTKREFEKLQQRVSDLENRLNAVKTNSPQDTAPE